MAVKIQERYHPKLLPAIPGLSLGHYYNTAGVCGDFFDVVPSRKDRISFVLADVAGKGMNSLLIMTMLRSILRLVLNTTHTASTILSWANRGISTEKTIDHFASIALVLYNSIDNTIQYANAGTSPIYLLRNQTGEFECLSKNSEPIGVEKTSVYSDNSTKVEKNDIIITFTDGLIEALDSSGNQYTTSRLTRLVKRNKDLTGKEIANKIKEDIKRFSGDTKQHDDQTLLVIKIL
jgi:sigma-B regulation protein RsbU (phosphoserine phosphatase)